MTRECLLEAGFTHIALLSVHHAWKKATRLVHAVGEFCDWLMAFSAASIQTAESLRKATDVLSSRRTRQIAAFGGLLTLAVLSGVLYGHVTD